MRAHFPIKSLYAIQLFSLIGSFCFNGGNDNEQYHYNYDHYYVADNYVWANYNYWKCYGSRSLTLIWISWNGSWQRTDQFINNHRSTSLFNHSFHQSINQLSIYLCFEIIKNYAKQNIQIEHINIIKFFYKMNTKY